MGPYAVGRWRFAWRRCPHRIPYYAVLIQDEGGRVERQVRLGSEIRIGEGRLAAAGGDRVGTAVAPRLTPSDTLGPQHQHQTEGVWGMDEAQQHQQEARPGWPSMPQSLWERAYPSLLGGWRCCLCRSSSTRRITRPGRRLTARATCRMRALRPACDSDLQNRWRPAWLHTVS